MTEEFKNHGKLVIALHHEFLRCIDSFDRFVALGKNSIGRPNDRKASYLLYNAYSQFIHHLYEFYRGCIELDKRRNRPTQTETLDEILNHELKKAIKNRRAAATKPDATDWDRYIISEFEHEPVDFGRRFREIRDSAFGHVGDSRPVESLTEFFVDHHPSLLLLFWQAQFSWSYNSKEFPDLGEVTKFQIAVREKGIHPPE